MAEKGVGRQASKITPTNGNNYLLVIAIDHYIHCPKLHNCVKDAKDITAILQDKYQFSEAHTTPLFNKKATRRSILRKLRELQGKVTPKDNLVILFSGHGDNRHGVGYWIPVEAEPDEEADFISTNDIINRLNVIDSLHTFVIVDACFSGSLFSTTKDIKRTDYHRPSRWGLAASHSKEVAVDGTPGDNSPFAERLLFKLKHSSEVLRVQELSSFVTDEVLRLTDGKQTPVSRPLNVKGDELGQFAFFQKRNEAQDWAAAQEAHSAEAYQLFLTSYPDGEFAPEAKKQLAILQEEELWQQTQNHPSLTTFRAYLDKYPYGKYARQAIEQMEQLEETADWKRAKWRDTESAYRKFLIKYPNSQYKNEAEQRIRRLVDRDNTVKREAVKEPVQEPPKQTSTPNEEKPKLTQEQSIVLGVLAIVLFLAIILWRPWQAAEPDERIENITTTDKFIEPEMTFVQGSTFTMGCKDGRDENCDDNEKPPHPVTVKDFHIGKYEVTFEEYDLFCEATNRKKPDDEGWGRGKRPVINVEWGHATAYCRWLSEQSGQNYRLPTEAEWEYAARGGNQSRNYQYAGSNDLDEVAWYRKNSGSKSHPVGQKQANELGIHDMSGNVWEWTADCWHDNYENAPDDGAAWLSTNNGNCDRRVIRGGSWVNYDSGCRVSNRFVRVAYYGDFRIGFRISRY